MNNSTFFCRFLLLIPILFPTTTAAEVLIFEYSRPAVKKGGCDCYYVLLLDTDKKEAYFYGSDCYAQVPYFSASGSFEYTSDDFTVYPLEYEYVSRGDIRLSHDSEDFLKNEKIYLKYNLKDNGNRIENASYEFRYSEEKRKKKKYREGNPLQSATDRLMTSRFLNETNIHWFPPYMDRVTKIDYNRFPEEYRAYLKERIPQKEVKFIRKQIKFGNQKLFFEYSNKKDCDRYLLILDPENEKGQLVSFHCYEKIPFLCISIRVELTGSGFLFYPTEYTYASFTTNEPAFYKEDARNKDNRFSFVYFERAGWKQLDFSGRTIDENKEKKELPSRDRMSVTTGEHMHISPFLKENEIDWFPPYLKRIDTIDYEMFPETYHTRLKKQPE